MHRGQRHGKQRNDHNCRDITVHDFADTIPGSVSGLRSKKSERSKHIDRKVAESMAVAEDLSWFDKDLDDFDITVDRGSGSEAEEIEEPVKKSSRKKKMKKQTEEVGGVTYPVDLWFQLSRYIYPESVGIFALLCRGTNAVVHSVQFWKTMYLRYYCNKENIPDDLRLASLDCIHGLRARVIRTLFYVYPPMVTRTQTTVPFENEPHALVGLRCLLTWHKKVKNVWSFYFKFRKGDSVDLSSNERKSIKSRDFEKWHQDFFYNPDDKSSILEVTCPGFTPLQVVMGLILNGVYLNVSAESMRYHRLKLIMDTNYRITTKKNQNSMCEIVLDPVLEVRVYPWWHPNFTETQSILLPNET